VIVPAGRARRTACDVGVIAIGEVSGRIALDVRRYRKIRIGAATLEFPTYWVLVCLRRNKAADPFQARVGNDRKSELFVVVR